MGQYTDYLSQIVPSYLGLPNGQRYLLAFSQVADELIANAKSVRKEAMSQECSDDTLPYHFQNTYTLVSPFETPAQMRAYLAGIFDTVWKQNGSPNHLLAELKRFGFPNAKIWTWTDLIQAGVPSAFGGNWTKIPSGMNGGMWYLPNADLGGPGWTIEHRVVGPNQPLSVTINNVSHHIVVNLKTDGASNPLSTALEIQRALENDPVIPRYLFFMYTGTGLGVASASAQLPMAFCYYTYYIIDLYEPHPAIVSFANWNDPGIFWNDNVTFWDGIVPGAGFLWILREVIRRATPATMSCRFIRVFTGAVAEPYPIADQWEEDANGNIVDFYTTHY